MTVITFAHVKKFFENADRDEFGYYNLGPVFLNSKIHIYDNFREGNICLVNSESDQELIVCKIYFNDDETVSMIPVNNGIAEYEKKKNEDNKSKSFSLPIKYENKTDFEEYLSSIENDIGLEYAKIRIVEREVPTETTT